MAQVPAAEAVSRAEGRGSVALWFGVLGAPIAWVIQLLLDYSLEEWWACSPATSTVGRVVGLPVGTAALLVSGLLTIVAVVAGLVSVRCYKKISKRTDEASSRALWMALAGIMNSILYLGLLIASFAPPILLGTCESSP
ncbi:MAG TPA: hypothetical protein VNP73_07600 [Actinomycetota bacterium]|nr:hypothetical protein [Actinomycetota bacterium]